LPENRHRLWPKPAPGFHTSCFEGSDLNRDFIQDLVSVLRRRLLAEAKKRPMIRLLDNDVREDAVLLSQLFPALALTEDEGRRLLGRVI